MHLIQLVVDHFDPSVEPLGPLNGAAERPSIFVDARSARILAPAFAEVLIQRLQRDEGRFERIGVLVSPSPTVTLQAQRISANLAKVRVSSDPAVVAAWLLPVLDERSRRELLVALGLDATAT